MISPTPDQELVLSLAAAWNRVERRLDGAVSHTVGLSFSEYRLLRTLADMPASTASRVDLAAAVGVTASGVTRALRPLEKMALVDTIRSERDARLALASLTDAGRERVADASSVIDDEASRLFERVPDVDHRRDAILALLVDLSTL